MAEDEFPREDELESRQAPGLYPVGRVLRQTYGADNHASLGTDLTGLMLELARIDPDGKPVPRGAPPPVAAPPPSAPPATRAPWWRAVIGRLLAR